VIYDKQQSNNIAESSTYFVYDGACGIGGTCWA